MKGEETCAYSKSVCGGFNVAEQGQGWKGKAGYHPTLVQLAATSWHCLDQIERDQRNHNLQRLSKCKNQGKLIISSLQFNLIYSSGVFNKRDRRLNWTAKPRLASIMKQRGYLSTEYFSVVQFEPFELPIVHSSVGPVWHHLQALNPQQIRQPAMVNSCVQFNRCRDYGTT